MKTAAFAALCTGIFFAQTIQAVPTNAKSAIAEASAEGHFLGLVFYDKQTGREVMDIIKRQHAGGTTVVMITHDPNIATMAQRTIKIVEGKIVE